MSVRLALAPVNWNNDDVPEWPPTVPYAEVAARAARLGYAGIEDGTGAPPAAADLRQLLAGHGLSLAGAFVWLPLSDPGASAGAVERGLAAARRLAEAGGGVLLVAEQWTDARRAVAGRAADHPELQLPPERVEHLCRNLDRLGRAVRDLGLRLALHPHVGSPVETPAELGQVMAGTDPAAVDLCLDTGHLVWGGGDAVELARRYAARVAYVHAKDVDRDALAAARERRLGLLDGLRLGVFSPVYGTPAGRSAVDIPAVAEALRSVGFGGWVVMECDRDPRAGDPDAEAAAALPRLAAAFGAAAGAA